MIITMGDLIRLIIGVGLPTVGITILVILYYKDKRRTFDDELDELAEACRYYLEKHPEVLDPYRTNRHKESEKEDG